MCHRFAPQPLFSRPGGNAPDEFICRRTIPRTRGRGRNLEALPPKPTSGTPRPLFDNDLQHGKICGTESTAGCRLCSIHSVRLLYSQVSLIVTTSTLFE